MDDSDRRRLSVSTVDVAEGREAEFHDLSKAFQALLERKGYGRFETFRDEAVPTRYYAVRQWSGTAAAETCHGDVEVQGLTSKLYKIARVTHVVNGVRRPDPLRLMLDDHRAGVESDRRSGFDRRVANRKEPGDERRTIATDGWVHGGCGPRRPPSIWWRPPAGRANMPTPRFRGSRSAPRSRRPTAR